MHKSVAFLPLVALAWSLPALAGEEILYAPVPGFVEAVDLEEAIAANTDVVLFDRHFRLEGGVVHQYSDIAFAVRSNEALRHLGTLQFAWLPDKGDLTIHRLHIVRGDQTIDVLQSGDRPQVLRRETRLEQRSLDGALTAAMPIPGLQVGDVLRYSISTTLRDQALQNEMQAEANLPTLPAEIGFGRVAMSWPSGSDVHWRAVGTDGEQAPVSRGGYDIVEIDLPLAAPEAMPEDAPGRYLVKPALQAGTFDSWEEVSRLMAPHFATEGTIAEGGEIARHVARIRSAGGSKLEQAAMALRLVQDEISYLANGLDGGNYLPQAPEQTWELRYGDCKAKSVLLLAMLRELGVEADAVLVDTENSDGASVLLPQPAAFNHMIVRASIDGTAYWLDGTSAGTRLDTISEVPDYVFALPLVDGGTGLARLEQRWPVTPDRVLRVAYDMGAGVDQPALFRVEMETHGVYAAQLRDLAAESSRQRQIGAAQAYLAEIVPGVLYDADFDYDADSGVGTLVASGVITDLFTLDRDTATHDIVNATSDWEFAPDRSRRAWRNIPFQVGGPLTMRSANTYLLPDDGAGASLTGTPALDETTAGTRYTRAIVIDGAEVRVDDGYSFIPAEIAPDAIAEERRRMRQITSGAPAIQIAGAKRSWQFDDTELAARMERFEEPLRALSQVDPDNAGYPLFAAAILAQARDYDGALDQVDEAIDIEESAQAHSMRADLLLRTGRHADALAAAERAYELQGDAASAMMVASVMALDGQADAALDMLDALGLSGDEAMGVAALWADISGHVGRQDEAWDRLADALADRPNDAMLLNSQCWLAGTWQTNLDAAEEVCDAAVTQGNHAAGILDSRALVRYRAGDLDGALTDLDAALAKAPGQSGSLYLRGIIRLERGDATGRTDIAQARRITPMVAEQYARWGIAPPA